MWHTKPNFSFEVAAAVQTLKDRGDFLRHDLICLFLNGKLIYLFSCTVPYLYLPRVPYLQVDLLCVIDKVWAATLNTCDRLREIQQTLIPSILHFVQCALCTLCVSVNTFLKRSIQKLGTTYHINGLRQIQQTLILSKVYYSEPYHTLLSSRHIQE